MDSAPRTAAVSKRDPPRSDDERQRLVVKFPPVTTVRGMRREAAGLKKKSVIPIPVRLRASAPEPQQPPFNILQTLQGPWRI